MDYTIQYTRRKNIALVIDRNARLVVRAPFGTSRAVIDAVVQAHPDWIARNRARQQQRMAQRPPAPTPQDEAQLRQRAQELLPQRVDYWARRMGLQPAGVRITAARSRYGSCSSRGGLCFSLFLLLSPPEAIDAVVVHELAHLRHRNHGPDFYRLVESILPNYRQRAKLLVHPPQKTD